MATERRQFPHPHFPHVDWPEPMGLARAVLAMAAISGISIFVADKSGVFANTSSGDNGGANRIVAPFPTLEAAATLVPTATETPEPTFTPIPEPKATSEPTEIPTRIAVVQPTVIVRATQPVQPSVELTRSVEIGGSLDLITPKGVVAVINRIRTDINADALIYDSKLEAVAQEEALYLLINWIQDRTADPHALPGGTGTSRAAAKGYVRGFVEDLVGARVRNDLTASAIVIDWMNSPAGHGTQVKSVNYKNIGVGCAIGINYYRPYYSDLQQILLCVAYLG